MSHRLPPLFITFEGGEGSGKSTQAKLLHQALESKGVEVVSFREPGGTPGAEEIRQLLLSGHSDRWSPLTEALLMNAARSDLVAKKILPHLHQGKHVICDRFTDSSLAYQGFGHGLAYERVVALNETAVGSLTPALTFIFLLDPLIGMKRVSHRELGKDRYEQLDLSFHHRVQQGYEHILHTYPERCVAIDATQPPEEIAAFIFKEVCKRLKKEDAFS